MKRAIVLAGGGAKGSYEIGVWRALRELGVDYQIVTGSSVGALNGAMMAMGDYDGAERMWLSLTTPDVVRVDEKKSAAAPKELLSSKAMSGVMDGFLKTMSEHMDPAPLEEVVRLRVNEAAVRKGAGFGVTMTEFPSMRGVELTMDDIPEGALTSCLMASSAFYPAMDPRDIGALKYVDGGYSDNMPVSLALDMGADEVVAVDLQAVGLVKPLKTAVPVRTIRCRWNLGPLMEFDPQTAARNITLGWNDAMRSYGVYEGWGYAFPAGTYESQQRRFGGFFAGLTEKGPGVTKLLAQAAGVSVRLLERRLVTAAAEAAGSALGVSPLKLWSAAEFDDALLAAADRECSALELTTKLLSSRLPMAELSAAAARLTDRAAVVRFAEGRVADAVSGGRAGDLRLLGAAVPKELFAAMYIYALRHLAD